MAHPLSIAEQAVKSFIAQWLNGLQPSMCLTTNADGSILVTSEVTSFQAMKTSFQNQASASRNSRRSGRNARFRRKLKRTTRTDTDVKSSRLPQPLHIEQMSPTSVKPIHIDKSVQAVVVSAESACETEPIPTSKTLSTKKLAPISIPPRAIYHPAIINATQSFYQKHPSELSYEEKKEFKLYLDQKKARGQPVEEDLIYLPTSLRNCLHCGHPT